MIHFKNPMTTLFRFMFVLFWVSVLYFNLITIIGSNDFWQFLRWIILASYTKEWDTHVSNNLLLNIHIKQVFNIWEQKYSKHNTFGFIMIIFISNNLYVLLDVDLKMAAVTQYEEWLKHDILVHDASTHDDVRSTCTFWNLVIRWNKYAKRNFFVFYGSGDQKKIPEISAKLKWMDQLQHIHLSDGLIICTYSIPIHMIYFTKVWCAQDTMWKRFIAFGCSVCFFVSSWQTWKVSL